MNMLKPEASTNSTPIGVGVDLVPRVRKKERRDEEHEWGETSNRRLAPNEDMRLLHSKASANSLRAVHAGLSRCEMVQ